MTPTFNRRTFLKASGTALLAAFLPDPETLRPFRPRAGGPVRMGRAIHTVTIYEAPRSDAARLGAWYRDDTFALIGEVHAPGLSRYNDVWYQTLEGYVHSAWVQPMWVWPPQEPITAIGTWGFWGEVCAPYTDARNAPHPGAAHAYRFYNGNTYHVVDIAFDDQGNAWYKIYDELPPPTHQWALARDIRRITREELAPIHPFAGEKRIEVDLSQQRLTCFEGNAIVFVTYTASGIGVSVAEDGTVTDLATPTGQHCVLLKQVSRHMSNRPENPEDPAPADFFDLPGVPWNTFFDLSGTAIHGAYWHNDFGVPRSHGCLNVSSDAARWIYRWTHPIGGAEDDFVQSDCRVGTPITIF
ncbi:MAG: L,D-transpeptidase [Anaerolineae bacterium]|nr:L,D-transpeptidase [Anaerolineae bacterium]